MMVRHPEESLTSWVRQTSDAAAYLYSRAHIGGRELWNGTRIIVACEDLNEPSPHVRTTNVRGILDTSAVIGGLARAFGDLLLLVPPAGFGTAPLPAYPEQLRGTREHKGRGVLRDCRQAWDIAAAAADLARLQGAAR